MLLSKEQKNNWSIQIPATLVTIALMVILPFLFHAVGGVPAGARWLPLFYAPLVAIILFNPFVAVVAGIIAPFVNHLLLGAPVMSMAFLLVFELVVFAVIMMQFQQRKPNLWGSPILAYLGTKVLELLLLMIIPMTLVQAPPLQFFSTSVTSAIPGILVLALIHWATSKGLSNAAN